MIAYFERDPDVWTDRRTLGIFLRWFDVEVCDLVADAGKGPLYYD